MRADVFSLVDAHAPGTPLVPMENVLLLYSTSGRVPAAPLCFFPSGAQLMTTANPLTTPIARSGAAPGPYSQAQLDTLRTLATTNPQLINQPVNSNTAQLPLNMALAGARLAAAKILVEVGAAAGVPVQVQVQGGRTALGDALWSNNMDTVGWVWESGLDRVLGPGLFSAAMNSAVGPVNPTVTLTSKTATVQWLLDQGLVPDSTSMLVAVQQFPSIATLFVSRGLLTGAVLDAGLQRDIDLGKLAHPFAYALLPDKSNANYVAVSTADGEALRSALAAPTTAPINSTLPHAPRVGTVLHYAFASGKHMFASLLLSNGADATLRTPSGESVVGAAAASGSLPSVVLALASADPEAVHATNTTPRGAKLTPLLAAVTAMRSAVVVQALVTAGADPTDVQHNGVNAAFYALYNLQDPVAANNAGYTADVAKAIITLLAAGNPAGRKVDLDEYNPVVRASVRSMAASMGIMLAK